MELKEIDMEDRILDKARELFFFFGIKRITMDDIAKHLGISKKTLYSHYKDKGEIVRLIMGGLLTEHVDEMLKVKENAKNAVEAVVLQSKILFTVFKDIKPNVFFEIEKHFPDLAGQFSEHRCNCMLDIIKQNLEKGKAEGFYREDLEIPFTAQVRLNQLVSAFDEKAYESVEFNLQHILDKITSFYLNAICNDKGKQLIPTYIK